MNAKRALLTASMTVILLVAGCGPVPIGAKAVREPIFTGKPSFNTLRQETRAAEALGFPEPRFSSLVFTVEDAASGESLGSMEITRLNSQGVHTRVNESFAVTTFGGRCLRLQETELISLGSLLTLQSVGTVWSPNCTGWGAGHGRTETTQITLLSGNLFPLKPGNRLALRYTSLFTETETDDGMSEYGESVEVTFHVTQRISDYRLPNGRAIGDVFLLDVARTAEGQASSTHEVLLSESIGWRVGQTTDLRVRLTDIRD